MPIFEYTCAVCGGTFESLFRGNDAVEAPSCPTCGSEQAERIFSMFAGQIAGKSGCGSTASGIG